MWRLVQLLACASLGAALKPFQPLGFTAPLTLHAYEHCQFCTRTRLVLGWAGVEHACEFYGYGDGADPSACEGKGYNAGGGPVPLAGKKSCPVLSGDDVLEYTRDGRLGLGESGEIISLAVARGAWRVAPATGRSDVSDWLARVGDTRKALERPRLVRMPVADFGDARDVEYSMWTHERQGFDYAAAEADTPALLAALAPLLDELAAMLRGRDDARDGVPSLNAWGLSIDDALVLPILRSLTVVKGIEFPLLISEYLEGACKSAGVGTFAKYAS